MSMAQEFIERAYEKKALEALDDPPEPECDHDEYLTRVTAGDLDDGPHASVWVCDRPACIQNAVNWAITLTRLPVTLHKKDPS
jgi:hypothetical protein